MIDDLRKYMVEIDNVDVGSYDVCTSKWLGFSSKYITDEDEKTEVFAEYLKEIFIFDSILKDKVRKILEDKETHTENQLGKSN